MANVARWPGINESAFKAVTAWNTGTIANAMANVARWPSINESVFKVVAEWNKGTMAKAMADAVRFPRLDESFFRVAFEWGNSSLGRAMNEVVAMPSVDESFFRAAIDLSYSSTSATWEEDEQNNNHIVEIFNALPPWSQHFVMWVICTIFLGALEDFAKGYVLKEVNSAEVYISSLLGNKPIKKIDIISVNPNIKWEDLNHFRLITGDNVQLRVKPSMKSEVIEVLNKNTAVAVIDKKDRQWLFVEVLLGEEKVQGWVNRSYTKRIGL
ncbi:SH3 domain-containing protein, partial [Yersinia enterocolitica]|uniref:SH3 domain-containing protein n=1 Tax=Yersinia enterocolitica TaxID=630 RepID=UPI003D00337E